MRLNNPQKFTENGLNGNLIAVCEILCQFSELENPISETDWTNEYDETKYYNWIRISFDNGNTFKIKYKLNLIDVNKELSGTFIIDKSNFIALTNDDYQYKFVDNKLTEEQFKHNVGKTLSISLFNADENNKTYVNIFAPVKWKNTTTVTGENEYSLEILVTDAFIDNYSGFTCVYKI